MPPEARGADGAVLRDSRGPAPARALDSVPEAVQTEPPAPFK